MVQSRCTCHVTLLARTPEQVAIAGINFVCGFILVIGSYVMEGLEETRDMQKWLVHVFRCVPPFNLGALL